MKTKLKKFTVKEKNTNYCKKKAKQIFVSWRKDTGFQCESSNSNKFCKSIIISSSYFEAGNVEKSEPSYDNQLFLFSEIWAYYKNKNAVLCEEVFIVTLVETIRQFNVL